MKNKNIVLCADGVMIEENKYKPELLNELAILVKNKFNFNLNFTIKEMNNGFSTDQIDNSLIFDLHTPEFTTGLLSDYFKILYDKFLFYDSKLYYFNGVYWENDYNFVFIFTDFK